MIEASPSILRGVEPEYRDMMFTALTERHGLVDAYLTEQLGLDDALLDKIGAALVEG